MDTSQDRRRLLQTMAAGLPLLAAGAPALAQEAPSARLGPRQAFSYDKLIDQARELARQPYAEPPTPHFDLLDRLDGEAYQGIHFRSELSLWADDALFPLQLQHPGKWFKRPVRISLLENGEAREILFSKDYFAYADPEVEASIPEDLGFAGFRLMTPNEPSRDWLSFLGASYFRSSGELDQFGASARGLAIDTALPKPEEFPRFSQFWLQRPAPESRSITIFALLEGPSVTGAYRFDCLNEGRIVTEVTARVFFRKAVERVGIAPLTSMYWYGPTNRWQATDWRPAVHDSEGLSIWTGQDERIWRPLNNPPTLRSSWFVDKDPKGFGLAQRTRAFAGYQDDSLFYERRPTIWVEPLDAWGEGAVQLVELPTDDEVTDNVVAYWLPKKLPEAGDDLSLHYRLHWVAQLPFPARDLARVAATRIGKGGPVGRPRPRGLRRFVIDFQGGPLDSWERDAPVDFELSASRGTIANAYDHQVVGSKVWRVSFELAVDGQQPVDLRLALLNGGTRISETWIFQYNPFFYPGEE